MKKILNNPTDIIDETIKGYVKANKKRLLLKEGTHIVTRKVPKECGKVKMVIGNGGGHEPGTNGQIGYGMYDMVCLGDVFAAQSGKKFFEAINEINDGSPILVTISNHAGDVMNGNMAVRLAEKAGITIDKVLYYDDITSAPKEFAEDRRGNSGMFFATKAAGAAAEEGLSLEECKRAFEKARDNTRTVSASLSGCTHPQTGMVMSTVPEDMINIGSGAHGEGGAEMMAMCKSADLAKKLADMLIEDKPYVSGEEVLLLVNGMGKTTMAELSILYNDLDEYFGSKGITVYDGYVGNQTTTQETAGVSISICSIDDELKKWWDAPCSLPVYSNM